MKILYIDSDEYYHQRVPEKLRLLGNVVSEHSAKEAWSHFETDVPDLVITELILEDEPAYGFIKKVRKYLSAGELPLVVYSSVSNKEDIHACLGMGANAYFVKGKNNLSDLYNLVSIYKS